MLVVRFSCSQGLKSKSSLLIVSTRRKDDALINQYRVSPLLITCSFLKKNIYFVVALTVLY